MKKRLLTMLVLLVAVAGAWADTTVTWTASDMTDLTIDFQEGLAADNTIKGITVTASSGGNGVWQGNNISMDEGSTTITFTSSVGNIKSIAITAQSIYTYGDTPSGWTMPGYTKLSWSGDASPTVSMTLSDWTEFSNITEIVFTIEPAPAPAAPTYSVTLAEGTEDGDNWTISPAEAAEGAKVTATYSGEKKVKSVKAVKKAPAGPTASTLAESTVGMIVGSDGKAYAVADKDNLPSGVTAVAMVAYKSGSNGLAIQFNGSPEKMNWADAKTYAEGLTAVSGGTWRLPSRADWQNMFVGCAVSGDATVPDANNQMDPIAGFKAKIAATGITWNSSVNYWASTESDSMMWLVGVNLGDSSALAAFMQFPTSMPMSLYVRAVLAF